MGQFAKDRLCKAFSEFPQVKKMGTVCCIFPLPCWLQLNSYILCLHLFISPRKGKESFLQELARDNTQVLFNELWKVLRAHTSMHSSFRGRGVCAGHAFPGVLGFVFH